MDRASAAAVWGLVETEVRRVVRECPPGFLRDVAVESLEAQRHRQPALNVHHPRHLLTSEGVYCGLPIGVDPLRVTTERAKATCFYCHFSVKLGGTPAL